MGEEEERCSAGAGCSFSLTCLEDGADLDTDGGKLAASLYGDAEEDQEYMNHLVSKESSFCRSPSSSSCSPVVSDAGAETCPCPSSMAASSHEWFRCARRATVEWVFEVGDRWIGSAQHRHPSLVQYPQYICISISLTAAGRPAPFADAGLLRLLPPRGVPGRLLHGPLLPPPVHGRASSVHPIPTTFDFTDGAADSLTRYGMNVLCVDCRCQ